MNNIETKILSLILSKDKCVPLVVLQWDGQNLKAASNLDNLKLYQKDDILEITRTVAGIINRLSHIEVIKDDSISLDKLFPISCTELRNNTRTIDKSALRWSPSYTNSYDQVIDAEAHFHQLCKMIWNDLYWKIERD